MYGPLKDKRALITGATGGAGLLAARALAQTGCGLYLSAINEDALNQVAADIAADYGVSCEVHAANAANAVNAEFLAMTCSDAEILITASGALPFGSLDDIGDKDWRKSWEASVFAPLNLIREMSQHMADEGRGLVILLIDTPFEPAADDICAAMAGAALKTLVKAQKNAHQNVRVLGLVTGRNTDGQDLAAALSRIACMPGAWVSGSLVNARDVLDKDLDGYEP